MNGDVLKHVRKRGPATALFAAALLLPLAFIGAQSGLGSISAGTRTAANPPSVGLFPGSLASALSIDVAHETVTLPLFKGRTSSGEETWYIVTESSSQADATARGVNWSAKMANAIGTKAVQKVHYDDNTLVFAGTVNFGLKRVVVPDPVNGFPPLKFAPGAKGDANYSPMVELPSGIVLNAPQVANETGKSGSVVAIDYGRRTVTLNMLAGWVDGQFTMYLHTDASGELVAALEASTYAPNLNFAPGLASDQPSSTRAAIVPVVNGIRGDGNPQRQGLQSALLGQGDPLNVAQEQPSDPVHYSPMWDVTPVVWTDAAIAAGKRVQLHSQDAVIANAQAGYLVSAFTAPPGTPDADLANLNSSGMISNCPIIVVFPGGPSTLPDGTAY